MTAPVPSESAMWRAIGSGWRQLFGDFRGLGVSFEWHEFTPRENLDWSRSFHPESLELCLNLAGNGEVGPAESERLLNLRNHSRPYFLFIAFKQDC